MKINELVRYDIPPEILALWRESESDILLPLQELAVKRHDLFGDGNLLIQAPTSSGKTFIGEMAALRAALHRKKVVYLVPLKALAEEKYHAFREKYAPYGLRVIVSTRDRREFDRDLENGTFSIAVVVYEKLSQLLVRRPERIEEMGLIIADELEILSDTDRGPVIELLLTRILAARRRLIGLSAVLGEAKRLAEWLKADLLFFERRPVELRCGVLYDGVFTYRTYNDFEEGEERLVGLDGASAWEILTENVCAFVERGEPCLIFVKAKHESRRGAELLAGRINHPPAEQTIEALKTLEATRSRDSLLETLANGVAFHNANLSREERRVVEEGFRTGEIKVLVSTSTLATGMNLPARNVFISTDKWRYDKRFGMPWKTPILHGDYENMGGRAGRYSSGQAFGRAILIATSPFDRETLWRNYIEGEREQVAPQLAAAKLEDHILQLVASHCCHTEDALYAFLENTLSGRWIWAETLTLDECAFHIRAAVTRAVDAGVVSQASDGRLEATPLGLAVASKGITIATASALEHWIGQSETRFWPEIDLILAAAFTADGRMVQMSLTSGEYDHAGYVDLLKRLTEKEDITADVPLNRIRNCNLMPFFDEVRAIKVALFLMQWLDQASLKNLEETFSTMTGQIVAAAEQISWLLDATAGIANALGAAPEFASRITTLSERVQHGVPEEALPLARLQTPELSRNTILALRAAELHTPKALADTPARNLTKYMPAADARTLKQWARRQSNEVRPEQASAGAPPPAAVLVLDERYPGQVFLDDLPVRLQEKQYQLIRLLAGRPGECVPYDAIYDAVWGEVIVEPNQMHFQKRKLVAALAEAAPHRNKLIRTVPKHGFVLDLSPEEVVLETPRATNAA